MTTKERLRAKLRTMPAVEQLALVEEICRICEKQYRKGYQHGFFHSKEGAVTESQANEFRYDGIMENYSKVIYPPFFKRKENPVTRVSVELAMADMEILRMLFFNVESNSEKSEN